MLQYMRFVAEKFSHSKFPITRLNYIFKREGRLKSAIFARSVTHHMKTNTRYTHFCIHFFSQKLRSFKSLYKSHHIYT